MAKDTTDRPELLFARLDEKTYQSELSLLDRYHAFSAEMLQIALVGVAACRFILKETFVKIDSGSRELLVGRFQALRSHQRRNVWRVCSMRACAKILLNRGCSLFFFYGLRLTLPRTPHRRQRLTLTNAASAMIG